MISKSKTFSAIVLTLCLASGAYAGSDMPNGPSGGNGGPTLSDMHDGAAPGQDGGPPHGAHHHGPPPEAIDACKGKTDGDMCNFTSPRGDKITGTCHNPPPDAPSDAAIACMPANGPPPRN